MGQDVRFDDRVGHIGPAQYAGNVYHLGREVISEEERSGTIKVTSCLSKRGDKGTLFLGDVPEGEVYLLAGFECQVMAGCAGGLLAANRGDTMPDIVHRVGIKSTPKKVFEALSTIDGLSHWWIVDTKGMRRKVELFSSDSPT